MSAGDLAIGAAVLVGNANWQGADWRTRLRAILGGRWRFVTHLDRRFWLVFWRGQPFLVWVGEA